MTFKIVKYDKNISIASELVIKNRLYTPGANGIRYRILEGGISTIFIVFDEEKPIGCLTVDQYPIKNGLKKYSIVNTWIKPKYRGLGLGGKLLKKAANVAEYTLAGYASKDGEHFYKNNNIKAISY